jgi:hypothetical protein
MHHNHVSTANWIKEKKKTCIEATPQPSRK